MALQPFHGVLVPVLTPFTPRGEPDSERFVAFCRWLLDQGAGGLSVFGTTSEANSMSGPERMALLDSLIEAGTPGDKLAPYLRPLNDALNERLGARRLKQLLAEGSLEIAPIAYMRGRTLNNAFIVIDEAQNCTYGQIKMLLTRLGLAFDDGCNRRPRSE